MALSQAGALDEAVKQAGSNIRSPISLTGIMLEILRHRFSPIFGLPYKWIPVSDELPHEESPDVSIRIQPGGDANRDNGSVKPGIYVVIKPTQFQQVVIGNTMHNSMVTGDKSFLAMAHTSFTFECEAKEAGISSVLADIVLQTFMHGAKVLEKTFDFHQVGPFSLSASVPARQEQEMFETHVSVGLQWQAKWVNVRLAPMFKEIVVKSKLNEDYFIETYTKSILANN